MNTNDIQPLCISGNNVDRVTVFKLPGVVIGPDLLTDSGIMYLLQNANVLY